MKVYIIGAGPGDPGLLTLKAKAVLEMADVVVYDYLANDSFLTFCRPDAECIYVGKKSGNHTLPQDRINALLVDKAREGKVIARLKGGDPYIFGRGAEEAEELLEAGIPVEVVPGVTSAVAAAACAGIPLTHRKYASSVSFITGHEDLTKRESALHWNALAKSSSTLVFFMGMKNLFAIAQNLIVGGRSAETPVALVRWGTTCRHTSIVSTLADVAMAAERDGFKAPCLIIVGEVVCLASTLNFFERRPLLGKGIVVTRAREQASKLLEQLAELGACCYQFPTIEVRPLDDYAKVEQTILRLRDYDWLVFTSANGVKYFWEYLGEVGLDTRILGGIKVAAIGPATAIALAGRGVNADLVPEQYVTESLVTRLLEQDMAGARVLIPRAREARELLPEELAKVGVKVQVLPLYEIVPAEADQEALLAAMATGEIHCITFASSSTVDNFFAHIQSETVEAVRPGVKLACIGPVTAKTLEKHGFIADIVPTDYTIPALVDALVDAFKV
ncbi:uroporphyrinogen III methyltransferase / synthase [Desulfovibrionales bacterium]